jgi:flagellar basal body rod protein FlgG
MPGGQYIALSALRTRMQQLDQLADDLSNVHTSGYRGARTIQEALARDEFGSSLQAAVDTAMGATRIDMTKGTVEPTGRDLDVAIEGEGFFVIDTGAGGLEYTRNGHFGRAIDGTLVTSDGAVVQGQDGPITLGHGDARIDQHGTVWSGAQNVGQLQIVSVADPGAMTRGTGARLRATGQETTAVDDPVIRPASLEASNVAMSEGLARLTSVSRNFEALQRAISTLLNEVDGRFIDNMARR